MERIVVKSDESQDLNEDCSIVSWNFDCPTDEILITSSASSPGAEARPTRMASARLATQSLGVGNGAGGDSASPEPERENPRDLIVIPATANSVQLQHAIQQVSSGGVTVLDVRGLQAGDSSGQSSPGGDAPGTVLVQAADGGHFITVSGDAGGVGYHVQYVEPQELYTQSQQAQMDPLRTYPVYTVSEGAGAAGGTLYAGAQWAGGGGSAAPYPQYLVAGAALDEAALPGQHRGVSPETVAEVTFVNTGGEQCVEDGDENGLGAGQQHAMRTPPATVQWLVENYETAEGVSLPRSTLYAHYLRHCTLRDLEPVNAASFGKLIRSVFLGLRTRRLGTRGNSKYHYYGIRIKPGSVLAGGCDNKGNISGKWNRQQTSRSESDDGSGASGSGTAGSSTPHQHQQYLGDASLPDFPDLELPANEMPPDCTIDDVDTLKVIYREHCEAFLEAVLQLELGTVEQLWREFWRQHTNDDCEEEKFLSKWKLYQLCACNEVQLWLRQVDVIFYQRVVEVLLPDVLRPIPSSLTQAIRNFAKGLEQWLSGALNGCPAGLVAAKSGPAAALAASLRRYTSLNHLAQAARAVLHNAHQVHQMLADLNRVDFRNVQEQAAWVCQCGEAAVAALEADFKATLGRAASLEQWAAWLEGAVVRALRPHERRRDYAMRARQFLLKWSFYSSMVIRDLTLRSAASFGSFHLIRLLYDEYMFYLVEQRVAAHSGRAPIAVMAEVNFDDPIIVNVNDVKKRNRDLDDVWIQDWDKEKGEGSDNGQGDGSPPEKKVCIS